MSADDLLRLIRQYAQAEVSAAIERGKDPWIQANWGCVTRREEYAKVAAELLQRIETELGRAHALQERP